MKDIALVCSDHDAKYRNKEADTKQIAIKLKTKRILKFSVSKWIVFKIYHCISTDIPKFSMSRDSWILIVKLNKLTGESD